MADLTAARGLLSSSLQVWNHECRLLVGQSLWMIPSGALIAVLYQASMGVGLADKVDVSGEAWGGAPSYFLYLAPGLLVLTLFNGAFTDSIDSIYKKSVLTGFYVDLLRRPVSALDVAVGAILAVATRSFLYAAGFLLCAELMGLRVSLIGAMVSSLLAALTFASIAVAVTLRARTKAELDALRFIGLPLTFFSGIFFPVDGYWLPLRWVIELLPVWQARHASGALLAGRFFEAGWSVLYLLLVLGACTAIARRRLIRLADR